MRRRGHGRVGWRSALLGALLLSVAGCGGKIVRLTRKGAYDEAIEVAAERAVPPRGRAARAYATALHERSRDDEARAVLLSDYRHGGDLRSLVALADLERELGLDGVAASHYGRVAELSPEALEGRPEVCALLRRRASVWATEGAGLAAERDLERADQACGEPADAATVAELTRLRARVDEAAQAQVDGRVVRSRCDEDCGDASQELTRGIEAAVDQARAEGPAALRRVASRLRVQLPPGDIVGILVADLRAEAGEAIITDDELRSLVGEQRWPLLAPVAMSESDELAAYLQLRLAAVMPDVPVARRTRTGPGEADVWLATVVEIAGEHGWRVLAWSGDLTGAELAIGEVWRPKRRPVVDDAAAQPESRAEPDAAASAPEPEPEPVAVAGIEPPAHWTSRVEATEQSLPILMLEGRLRHVAGQAERSLGIHRYAAARGLAAELPQVDALVAREAAWHLAYGRPWHALAVAEPVALPQTQRVAAAAATALRLTQAFCGGPCNDDRDRGRVELSLGEDWVRDQQEQLVSLSRARTTPIGVVDTCPTLGELLASDAHGRLADALQEAREQPRPGHARRLREAIEADLGLGCAGRFVLPLLRAGGYGPTAGALAESLAHDATLDAPSALAVHAGLAMVGGRPQQADLLATAAAAVSSDPASTWRELARQAHATGHRELALRSLREALMHTPGLDDPTLHRAMVVASLAGIGEGWSLRETDAGRDEPVAHVADLVERADPAARWAVREDLVRALAGQPWLDVDARVRLEPALWPEPDSVLAHPIAAARLRFASGSDPGLDPASVGPMEPDGLELLLTMRAVRALPDVTRVFVEPERLEGARLALATHGRQWVPRWRTAVGLATYGTAARRAEAMQQLLEMAEEDAKAALVAIMLEAPAVIETSAEGELREAPLVASPRDELALAFGQPLDGLGI